MSKFIFTAILAGVVLTGFAAEEKIIIVDEGQWQTDNGRLSYFEDDRMISNEWFREINGYKLGDTPNYIIRINKDLIAIAVNWSNIIQFISPDGKAVAAVENIPNVRCLATDEKGYLYATSYAHECETINGTSEFEKGFVAKIDTENFNVITACETGYEPEGIAYYDGKLFIANSGGYAFQEGHEYESTISIIDAATMREIKLLDTGHINLCGEMSQSGKYLCLTSAGDYYETPGCGMIIDCEKALNGDENWIVSFPQPATYNTPDGNNRFYAIGAGYSYFSGEYEFYYLTLDAEKIIASSGKDGILQSLPGNMKDKIMKMDSPYGIYRNPYTGMLYVSDAGGYASGGKLYQFTPDGIYRGEYATYINPGCFLALPPDSQQLGISTINTNLSRPAGIFDLQGRKILNPRHGSIYIINGKKVIF